MVRGAFRFICGLGLASLATAAVGQPLREASLAPATARTWIQVPAWHRVDVGSIRVEGQWAYADFALAHEPERVRLFKYNCRTYALDVLDDSHPPKTLRGVYASRFSHLLCLKNWSSAGHMWREDRGDRYWINRTSAVREGDIVHFYLDWTGNGSPPVDEGGHFATYNCRTQNFANDWNRNQYNNVLCR